LFTRVHTDVEGTGIGLATCQRIIAAHHGTLSFRDTPGGGTTVTVTLPPAQPTASPQPCSDDPPPPTSQAGAATESAVDMPRPSMADARAAVHRSHGDAGALVWARLLHTCQLTGQETDDDALQQLLQAMTALDPVSRLCAHAIGIRLTAHTLTASTTRSVA
jgi:hypothetical protein